MRFEQEEITTLQVTNMDDPEEGPNSKGQRVLGIMVPASWWADANPAARQMLWLGLRTKAAETWREQDAVAAAAEAALPVAADEEEALARMGNFPTAEYQPVTPA